MAYHTRSFQISDILIPPGVCVCYCYRPYFEEELPLQCECGTVLKLRGKTLLASRDESQNNMSEAQEFLSYQRRFS